MPIDRARRLITLGAAAVLAISAVCHAAQGQERRSGTKSGLLSGAQAAAPRAQAAPRRSPDGPVLITVKNGLLSVAVGQRPLAWVLEQVSRAGGPVILGDLTGSRERRVTLRLKDVPLDQGIREILKDYDTFFYYEAQPKGFPTLKAVWGYPKGRGRGLMPVPPEAWASTKEIESLVHAPDPNLRARGVATLIERKGAGALDTVTDALADQADQVRTQALYGALNVGVPIPAETLSLLVLTDPSPDVRFLALEALAADPADPAVAAIVEQAQHDVNPAVQTKAREILKRVGTASRSPSSRAAP